MGYNVGIMSVEAKVPAAASTTEPNSLERRGLGPRVSADQDLLKRVDNPTSVGSIRRLWRRLSPGAKITIGVAVVAGAAVSADALGIVDFSSIGQGTTIPTIDPDKCFTVPGTEAQPLDVCEVVN